MKRILSVYIVILFLAVIDVAAQNNSVEVTFTIDSIKGSNTKYGGLTAVADSMMFGGIAIKGTNASFGISESTTYRFYKGTTTFSALFGNITTIEFTFANKHEVTFKTPKDGKYSKGTWTGNAQSVTLETSTAGWVEKIVVTYTPWDITLDGDGSITNPFSVKDAVTLIGAKENSDVLQETYVNVKGIVSSIQSGEEITTQKTCYYSIVDNIGDKDSLVVKAGRYLKNTDFTSSDQLMKGDQVVLCGKLSSSGESQSESVTTELVGGNYIARFWGNELTVDDRNEKNEVTANMRHATVKLYRTFSSDSWNTLVLPFDMTEEQVKETFGEDTQLANYVGTKQNADGTYTLKFEDVKTITANIPLFVYGAATKVDKTLEDVGVISAPATHVPSGAVFAFTGSYDKTPLQANDWYISSDNKFYLAVGGETMKATRAVFRPVKTEVTPQSLKTNLVDRPTGVANVIVDALSASDSLIYNLAGQRVSENYPGIVIKGGKKYLKP
jgi:hypothetical protein